MIFTNLIDNTTPPSTTLFSYSTKGTLIHKDKLDSLIQIPEYTPKSLKIGAELYLYKRGDLKSKIITFLIPEDASINLYNLSRLAKMIYSDRMEYLDISMSDTCDSLDVEVSIKTTNLLAIFLDLIEQSELSGDLCMDDGPVQLNTVKLIDKVEISISISKTHCDTNSAYTYLMDFLIDLANAVISKQSHRTVSVLCSECYEEIASGITVANNIISDLKDTEFVLSDFDVVSTEPCQTCRWDEVIVVDTGMVRIVQILNRGDIETLFCCEGHSVDNIRDTYILISRRLFDRAPARLIAKYMDSLNIRTVENLEAVSEYDVYSTHISLAEPEKMCDIYEYRKEGLKILEEFAMELVEATKAKEE